MKVKIQATNFELTPALKQEVETKVEKSVTKLLGRIDKTSGLILDIELEKTTKHHRKGKIWRAEFQLNVPGLKKQLRAEHTDENINISVNEARKILEREIKKYKEK